MTVDRHQLGPDEQDAAWHRALEVLQGLQEVAESSPTKSWIGRNNASDERSQNCRFFDTAGFLHVPGFASLEECESMKKQMFDLVEKEWKPDEALDSFGTDSEQNIRRGDYFLDSADRVHYFAEPHALEECKATGRQVLKEEFRNDKVKALNKAGHAMHIQEGAFRDYCLSAKMRELVTDLGWKDPVVPQSMYIFKQALTGGLVTSHQDSTFLFTTPKQSCLGLWLALDDASLENGCLWVRPGSHQESVRRQYKRNPAHFGASTIRDRSSIATGDTTEPKLVMQDLYYDHQIRWDGKLPEDGGSNALLQAGFIPLECKAGDLLTFCGELDHLSLPNHSSRPRHTFQLHLVEGPDASVTWSEYNWLQYPKDRSFIRLRDYVDS